MKTWFAGLLMLLTAWSAHAAANVHELEKLNLAHYQGKVVYLDFWASWCKPCRRSFPWMNEMQTKYGDDLVVVAINVDKMRSLADIFLNEIPANFPIYFDSEGKWPADMKIKGMPSSIILDRNGKEAFRHNGFFPEKTDTYEQEILSLIKHKGA